MLYFASNASSAVFYVDLSIRQDCDCGVQNTLSEQDSTDPAVLISATISGTAALPPHAGGSLTLSSLCTV